jgi:Transglycosylase SLT domain
MREIAVALLLAWSSAAAAEPPEPAQSADCSAAIASAERSGDIPAGLLAAIAHVESSGRPDPAGGAVQPWPWTIDVGGDGRFFATKAEAVAATRELQAQGVASIDVGCLQVNLAYHPAAFASLEEAFDPVANSLYAARFLRLLFSQTGDWPAAIAAYHSQTHERGAAYQGKVLAVWTPSGSATPPADSRRPGFDAPDRIGAGLRDGDRWSAALDGGSSAWRPITPSVPSSWVERVMAAVAVCAMPTEAQSPPRGERAEVAPAWKGAKGSCPASPFAKPAALRQLLAGP